MSSAETAKTSASTKSPNLVSSEAFVHLNYSSSNFSERPGGLSRYTSNVSSRGGGKGERDDDRQRFNKHELSGSGRNDVNPCSSPYSSSSKRNERGAGGIERDIEKERERNDNTNNNEYYNNRNDREGRDSNKKYNGNYNHERRGGGSAQRGSGYRQRDFMWERERGDKDRELDWNVLARRRICDTNSLSTHKSELDNNNEHNNRGDKGGGGFCKYNNNRHDSRDRNGKEREKNDFYEKKNNRDQSGGGGRDENERGRFQQKLSDNSISSNQTMNENSRHSTPNRNQSKEFLNGNNLSNNNTKIEGAGDSCSNHSSQHNSDREIDSKEQSDYIPHWRRNKNSGGVGDKLKMYNQNNTRHQQLNERGKGVRGKVSRDRSVGRNSGGDYRNPINYPCVNTASPLYNNSLSSLPLPPPSTRNLQQQRGGSYTNNVNSYTNANAPPPPQSPYNVSTTPSPPYNNNYNGSSSTPNYSPNNNFSGGVYSTSPGEFAYQSLQYNTDSYSAHNISSNDIVSNCSTLYYSASSPTAYGTGGSNKLGGIYSGNTSPLYPANSNNNNQSILTNTNTYSGGGGDINTNMYSSNYVAGGNLASHRVGGNNNANSNNNRNISSVHLSSSPNIKASSNQITTATYIGGKKISPPSTPPPENRQISTPLQSFNNTHAITIGNAVDEEDEDDGWGDDDGFGGEVSMIDITKIKERTKAAQEATAAAIAATANLTKACVISKDKTDDKDISCKEEKNKSNKENDGFKDKNDVDNKLDVLDISPTTSTTSNPTPSTCAESSSATAPPENVNTNNGMINDYNKASDNSYSSSSSICFSAASNVSEEENNKNMISISSVKVVTSSSSSSQSSSLEQHNINSPSSSSCVSSSSANATIQNSTMIATHKSSASTGGGAWRPSNRSLSRQENIERQVKSLLNKLTVEKFPVIVEKLAVLEDDVKNAEELQGVVNLVMDKAVLEPEWSEMYADLCQVLKWRSPTVHVNNDDTNNNNDSQAAPNTFLAKLPFGKALVNKVQEEYLQMPRTLELSEEEKKYLDEQEQTLKIMRLKKRIMGVVKLIGELFQRKMLGFRVMSEVVTDMVVNQEEPDEHFVECFCQLITTTGYFIDQHENLRGILDAWFGRLKDLFNKKVYSRRLKCVIEDVLDLKKSGWRKKIHKETAKALNELRDQLECEEALGGATVAAQYGNIVVVGKRSNAHSDGAYAEYMRAQEQRYRCRMANEK